MKADRRLSLVVRVAIDGAALVCVISAGIELVAASLVMHHGEEAMMAQANADIGTSGSGLLNHCHAKRMNWRPVIAEQRNKKRLVVCTTSRRKISEGVIKTTSSLQPSLQPS